MAKLTSQEFEQSLRLATNQTINDIRSDLREGLLSVKEELIRPALGVVAPPPPKVDEVVVTQERGNTFNDTRRQEGGNEQAPSNDVNLPNFAAFVTKDGVLSPAIIYGVISNG